MLHWDVLNAQEKANADGILQQGGRSSQGSLYFFFWINQDSYIPPDKFNELVQECLQTGIHRQMKYVLQ